MQIKFSLAKFNGIFAVRALLLGLPGICVVALIVLALNGKGLRINASAGAARVAAGVMVLALLSMLTAPPYYFSNLSLFRKSYIVKNENELTYIKCSNSLPILDERTDIYRIEDIKNIKIKGKKIHIEGRIKKYTQTGLRKREAFAAELTELEIPDVFRNSEALVQ